MQTSDVQPSEATFAEPAGRGGLSRLIIRVAAVALVAGLAAAMFFVGRAAGDDSSESADHGGNNVICTPGEPGCIYGETIHEHGDFALFINGERWDFGQDKYVAEENDDLSQDVHIHHPRHSVVHVHKEHVTWRTFFETLGFTLEDPTMIGVEQPSLALDDGRVLRDGEGGTFKFFVNGVQVEGIGDLEIRSLQRVLISFGPETAEEVQAQVAQVTDEACIPGGLCPSRGSGAGEHGEPEPCSGQGACTGGD